MPSDSDLVRSIAEPVILRLVAERPRPPWPTNSIEVLLSLTPALRNVYSSEGQALFSVGHRF